jgi:PAS domain S-box-containing protein
MTKDTASPVAACGEAGKDVFDELPLPYLELDAYGVITRANRATYAMHPPDRGSLIGLLAWESMPTDEQQQNCAAYLTLMESGEEPGPVHRTVYVASGGFRTFEMHRRLIRDGAGKPIGMRILSVDVTESKRRLEKLRLEYRWLECSLQAALDAVVISDTMGFIQRLNPAAEALLGWKAEELIGQPIEKGIPLLDYSSADGSMLTHAIALERPTCGVATILDHQGRELRLEIRTAPVVDLESGTVIGVVGSHRKVEAPG